MINTLSILTHLREKAFDAANSGRYGNYPTKMKEFNDEVEKGFNAEGTVWSSKDERLVLSCEGLLWYLRNNSDQGAMEFLVKNQDEFDSWKQTDRPIFYLFAPGQDWVCSKLEDIKELALQNIRAGDSFLEISVHNCEQDRKLSFTDYEDVVEDIIGNPDTAFKLKQTLFRFRTKDSKDSPEDFPVMDRKEAESLITNMTGECFWQPMRKNDNTGNPFPEGLHSFEVFASRQDCITWLRANKETPEEYDILPFFLKYITGPSLISDCTEKDYDYEPLVYLQADIHRNGDNGPCRKAFAIVGNEHLETMTDDDIKEKFKAKLSLAESDIINWNECEESDYEKESDLYPLVSFLAENLRLEKQFAL